MHVGQLAGQPQQRRRVVLRAGSSRMRIAMRSTAAHAALLAMRSARLASRSTSTAASSTSSMPAGATAARSDDGPGPAPSPSAS